MADQAKGKGIAPKRASNLADPGQSSRPLLPIRTLLEDKEDGEDYSEASIEDSVSAIKNISSTLASLTNSSNAAATGKTSYSPRFDPFSGTIDLDSPLRPSRKEPYLGPAVNSATSNLDPPIDTGSKEGFKDTITSNIVKELSKKAYTIPDDKNPNISNTYSDSDQAVLLILLRNSLSSGPRAAISQPIESKKEDVYNELHALTFSTYKKGLLAFNAEFNGYLAKLTIAKIDIDPSLILNQNLATEAYRAAHIANSSHSTPNSNSNPSKKGKNKKKGSYNLAIEEEEESDSSSNSNHISNSKERFTTFTPNIGQLRPINTRNSPISPAGIGSITLEVLSRKAPPTYTKLVLDNVLYLPNINKNIVSGVRHYDSGGCLIKETLYGGDRRCIAVLDFKKSGFFLNIKGSSKPILHANFAFPLGLSSYTTKSIEPDLPCMLREPVIEGNKVVEKAISSPTLKEPNIGQRDYYNLLNLAKLWHVRLGHIGLRLLKKTSSITKGLPNFDKIKEADFHCSSYNRGKAVRRVSKALIPDLPRVLDSIKGDTVKIRPRPYNRNPIVLLLVDRKSRYRWVFHLPNKSGPIVANAIKGFFRGLRNGFGKYPTKFHFNGGTEITDLLTTWLAERGIKFGTSAPYIYKQNGLVERLVRVILDFYSTAITNKETTPFQALFNELEPGIPYIPNLERYRAIGARGEAIIPLEKRSKSLKFTSRTEECKLLAVLGSKTYLVYIPSRRAVLKTSTVKFIEDNTVLSQPTDNTALEGELVDLDLDLEGAVSPDPSNLNTEKPISIEIGPSKLEPYESSSDSELDEPLPDKPINPVIVESTRPTISIRKPKLLEAFP
ncbi:hypothetical protein P8C59_001025 [Phyllachora maydis]|uniref:Integrase catalytic domain-containing protein n=1 Tax=Phyllachora maydis TaxID=1825666 RepID=A0AAD9HYH8_9PEZI|nr:hypothetical protein P8C59_001025 [Phyllachora maydis]